MMNLKYQITIYDSVQYSLQIYVSKFFFNIVTVYKTENTTIGIRHADHVVPSPQKLALTSPRSVQFSRGLSQRSLLLKIIVNGILISLWGTVKLRN
jgi:hypothetical protein